jgi:hypothetical protein
MVVALVLLTSAATAARDRSAINSQTHRLERAFETKEFDAWRSILSDNFQVDGKKVEKSLFVAGAQAEAARALAPISVRVRNVSFRKSGSDVLTEARELTCYDFKTHKGLRHHLCYRQHFIETWRLEAAEWKLAAIHALPGRDVRVDGVRVSGSQAHLLMNE